MVGNLRKWGSAEGIGGKRKGNGGECEKIGRNLREVLEIIDHCRNSVSNVDIQCNLQTFRLQKNKIKLPQNLDGNLGNIGTGKFTYRYIGIPNIGIRNTGILVRKIPVDPS